MALRIAERVTVDVPRDVAFRFLQDPRRLAACIPGCRDVQETAPGRYSAVLSNRVALVTLTFKVAIEIVKLEPPDAIEAAVAGDAIGLPGRVTATAALRLADEGERRTRVDYSADIALTGKLGGLGEPVFRATTAQLARQFGNNLKKAIEAEPAGIPA